MFRIFFSLAVAVIMLFYLMCVALCLSVCFVVVMLLVRTVDKLSVYVTVWLIHTGLHE